MRGKLITWLIGSVLASHSFVSLAADGFYSPAAIESAVQSLTADTPPGELTQVIVNLKKVNKPAGALDVAGVSALSPQADTPFVADAVVQAAQAYGTVKDEKPFKYVPAFPALMDENAIRATLQDPNVASIEPVIIVEPALRYATAVADGLTVRQSGYDGNGTAIAIIDTGIYTEHEAFAGRVVEEACFSYQNFNSDPTRQVNSLCYGGPKVAPDKVPTEAGADNRTGPGSAAPCEDSWQCSHGTHVTGIAAGAPIHNTYEKNNQIGGDSHKVIGMAPAADIIAINSSFDYCGKASQSACIRMSSYTMLNALEYVYSLKDQYNIVAVNMSIGGGNANAQRCSSSLTEIIQLLKEAGIATVIAAGNDGHTNGITYPACTTGAISVGAMRKAYPSRGTHEYILPTEVADFSNSVSWLDLLAPGAEILAANYEPSSWIPETRFIGKKSGTSMAAPMVTGAFAQIRSAFPDASVDDILNALKSTGLPITDEKSQVTTPFIQVGEAIQHLGSGVMPNIALEKQHVPLEYYYSTDLLSERFWVYAVTNHDNVAREVGYDAVASSPQIKRVDRDGNILPPTFTLQPGERAMIRFQLAAPDYEFKFVKEEGTTKSFDGFYTYSLVWKGFTSNPEYLSFYAVTADGSFKYSNLSTKWAGPRTCTAVIPLNKIGLEEPYCEVSFTNVSADETLVPPYFYWTNKLPPARDYRPTHFYEGGSGVCRDDCISFPAPYRYEQKPPLLPGQTRFVRLLNLPQMIEPPTKPGIYDVYGRWRYSTPANATVRLIVTDVNDNWENALTLSDTPSASSGAVEKVYNNGFTNQAGEPALREGAAYHTAWWRWTPSEAGRYLINSQGVGFRTVMDIYEDNNGTPGARVAAKYSPGSNLAHRQTTLKLTVQSGQSFFIVVGSAEEGSEGELHLSLSRMQDPARRVVSDFNGDGRSDLLWRNQVTGLNWIHNLDGSQIKGSNPMGMIEDLNWVIVGTGDYDGNKTSDILWRNEATGLVWIWLLDKQTIIESKPLVRIPDLAWVIVASPDLNGDGKSDIVWRKKYGENDGLVWVYQMQGARVEKSRGIVTAPPFWKIVATGDMNGDGKDDLIWRSSYRGDMWIYNMDGFAVIKSKPLFSVGFEWDLEAVTDLNYDGKADFIWYNKNTGLVWMHHMNNTEVLENYGFARINRDAGSWEIKLSGDIDGDGYPDLTWKNKNTGLVWSWILNYDINSYRAKIADSKGIAAVPGSWDIVEDPQ